MRPSSLNYDKAHFARRRLTPSHEPRDTFNFALNYQHNSLNSRAMILARERTNEQSHGRNGYWAAGAAARERLIGSFLSRPTRTADRDMKRRGNLNGELESLMGKALAVITSYRGSMRASARRCCCSVGRLRPLSLQLLFFPRDSSKSRYASRRRPGKLSAQLEQSDVTGYRCYRRPRRLHDRSRASNEATAK